jgi:hypothetical protein
MTTISADADREGGRESTRKKISALRRCGKYQEGHHFISGLSVEDRNVVLIAIEAAQLYLVQGHYIRAVEVTASIPRLFVTADTCQGRVSGDIFDEDSVCLELLRAYIDISRHCKLKSAVSIAKRIHAIWLAPEGTRPMRESLRLGA